MAPAQVRPRAVWGPSMSVDAARLNLSKWLFAAQSLFESSVLVIVLVGVVLARITNGRCVELLVPRAEDWVVTGNSRHQEGPLEALGPLEGFVDVRTLGTSLPYNTLG